jgi:hydrogenase expression/formation protein HypC
MCLAVPGEIVELEDSAGLPTGKARFGGIVREVCLAYVPEAKVGDYVIVHAGFAISMVEENEAKETLRLIEEIAATIEAETPEDAA